MRIVRVACIPEAFIHFKKMLFDIAKSGVDLKLVSGKFDYGSKDLALPVPVEMIPIPREISPVKDIYSLIRLFLYFKTNKIDVVHSTTPKAGLLVSIAAFLARVPKRYHTFTGQRWATLSGPFRELLKLCDKIMVLLNTRCLADSPSQVRFLESEGIARPGVIGCIHKGCLGGIDLERFNREKLLPQRAKKRAELGYTSDDIIFLFVGRINGDKGINELVEAFSVVEKKLENAKLLVVGPFEDHLVPVKPETLIQLKNSKKIKCVGFQKIPEEFFIASDVFVMPSYREGFGTVILEAAALGIPAIGTSIPGLVDAIVDGETGILVPVKTVNPLADAMVLLGKEKTKREKMGECAKNRAIADFDYHVITEKTLKLYREGVVE